MDFESTGRWPDDFERQTVVDASVEDLEAKGIKFTKGNDELGPYRWAAGEMDGAAVGFDFYDSSQEPGVAVWAATPEDAASAVEALGVKVVWMPGSWPKEDQPYAAPEEAQKPFG